MVSALLLAFALVPGPADWVPARWPFSGPGSLSLLDNSPINCLIVERAKWSPALVEAAHRRGLSVLASVAPGDEAKQALALGADGIVIEGDAAPDRLRAFRTGTNKPMVYLPSRSRILAAADTGPVVGTVQGLWPGIHVEKEGTTKAGPTSGPWIDTNFGFLQFLRSAAPPGKAVWMANRPPEKVLFGPERYVQAWADAALSGARWVLALDPGYAERLERGEEKAVAGWRRINDALRFYQQHRDLCELPDYATLAIVQDASSGGLLSGSFRDMLAPRHIPAILVPTDKLVATTLPELTMLLNTDPAGLSPEQKQKVTSAARKGATLVNGPPAWKLAIPPEGAITFDKTQLQKLDDILRDINQLIGRRNMGVRVFNAPGTLSSLRATPDGKKVVLHVVNYTNYPIEAVTAEVIGKFKTATLLSPQGTRSLTTYDADDATGVEIDKIDDVGIVVFERPD